MHRSTTKNLNPEYQPDEKFMNYGPKALSDAELLAIILRTGSAELNSVELAREILSPKGEKNISISNIFNYEICELLKIRGIGKVKAIQIKAIAELSLRIAQSRLRPHLVFNDPEIVAKYYMEQLRHERNEQVVLLMLNSACALIKEHIVSVGTVNASLLSAREIFLLSLKYDAVYIILLHNHPSGRPVPSDADIRFTDEIKRAGDLIGIKLLDHIIIGDNSYYSFKDKELIHG